MAGVLLAWLLGLLWFAWLLGLLCLACLWTGCLVSFALLALMGGYGLGQECEIEA
jgi:hypothetical protein